MKCPYCAEEVKDEAVVCRHCGRDFSLFKPLLARLKALEEKAEALPGGSAQGAAEPVSGPALGASLAVALGLLFTSGYFLTAVNPPLAGRSGLFLLAIALPPAVLGTMLGVLWHRRNLAAYLAAGFSLGVLNLLGIWLTLTSFEGAEFRWPLALLAFVLGQPLTFVTSAFVANALRSRFSPPGARKPGAPLELEPVATKISIVLGVLGQLASLVVTIASSFGLLGGSQP